MNRHHPFVSERHEGKPWFEWCVCVCVIVSTALAAFGYTMAATVVLAVAAIGSGVLRLVLRELSPWKIRSVPFDACCGIGFGVALLALYLSIFLLNH